MDTPEYTLHRSMAGARSCRPCLLAAFASMGLDAEATLKDAILAYQRVKTAERNARLRPPPVSHPLQVESCAPSYKLRACQACLTRALETVGIDAQTWRLAGYPSNRKVYPHLKASDAARKRLRYANDPAFRVQSRLRTQRSRAKKPEQYRLTSRNNKHLRRTNGGNFTPAQWEAMQQLYGYRCVYCHKKPKKLTMDHVIPVTKGGRHTWDNIVPACGSCNSRKGPRPAPMHQPSLKLFYG